MRRRVTSPPPCATNATNPAREKVRSTSAKRPLPTDSAPAGSTASRQHSQQAAQLAGWKPNAQPLVVVFTAVGGVHGYASASAHGGCKHRPARAAASEHVLHGEHVRGAGQRQHVRQAARGREVEGVTNGTPVTGSTAPDRTRHAASESPAVSVSGWHTRSHTSSVVASTSSAPHERWGWVGSRRSPPRGCRGRSQVARKGSCPCARRAACRVTATRARGRLVFHSSHHRQQDRAIFCTDNACNIVVSHECGPAVDAQLNPNLHANLRS